MAEMQTTVGNHKKRGGQRSKKLSTRVDLTPMVDLGFLLITFFIFTTTLSEAKAMQLHLPKDGPATTDVPLSKVLNIVAIDNNRLFYYEGDDATKMKETHFGPDGIRSIIIRKKLAVAKQCGDGQQMVVLIKPTDKSNYQNVVDLLDEMLINTISRYILVDANAQETMLAH
jgi:biopolymer transport protein ExbD